MKTNIKIKPFRDQFLECKKGNFHGQGALLKFKDHPELLPLPTSKISVKLTKEIKDNPDCGITPILCLRFGGNCHSGNAKCRKLRETEI